MRRWFCPSTFPCSTSSSSRHSFSRLERIHRPSKDRRSLPFVMMNSVTNSMDNDTAERMRVRLVRFHLAYVRPSHPFHLHPPLVRVIQARWTCQYDNGPGPQVHSPSRSIPLPKPLHFVLLLPSRSLRRCIPRVVNVLRPAWCISQSLSRPSIQAQLTPSSALLGFHPSRVRRLDGCLGGQPPSLRFRRQHQPW